MPLLLLTVLLALVEPVSAQLPDVDEVVVVTGRVPGPPLWRVHHGENTLHIFPTLSPVPDGMDWDSARVEYVLDESREVLMPVDIEADFSVWMMMNPINLWRGARLARRIASNPDEASLESVLPAELYARFDVLRERYLPGERNLDEMRPLFAGSRLSERALRAEGLVSGGEVTRQVERLIRRTRGIERTEVSVEVDLNGSFRELADRIEALVASLPREQELACFTEQIRRLESELPAMKSRANAWAEGNIDQFRGVPLPGDAYDACVLLIGASSEYETIQQLRDELDRRWLAAAERALATNASTFAILDIVTLLRDDGLLAQLAARGYRIVEPGIRNENAE